MNQVHEFPLGIYPYSLWVCCDTKAASLDAYFSTASEETFGQMPNGTAATTYEVETAEPPQRAGVLIRFNKRSDISYGFVAHEAAHAAIIITTWIKESVTYEHQEPFAYLVGYIADCCKQILTFKKS